MSQKSRFPLGAFSALVIAGIALGSRAEGTDPRSSPPLSSFEPTEFRAQQLAAFPAPEALQGAAVDREHVYAIASYAIARYDRQSGERKAAWLGERRGLIGHLNSCFVQDQHLWCANSNHPEVPMASSVEVFDAESLRHLSSTSLGIMDEGSLTWFDRLGDGWIAGFAHYDDETGDPFKDNAYAGVYLFDDQWRRMGGWRLPTALIERMAPQAASGGAVGNDGLLYLFGHHRPELYVLARPAMGPTLLHVATIAIEAEGQAFAFAPDNERVVWAISRPNRELRAFRLPEIPLERPHARRFETRRGGSP